MCALFFNLSRLQFYQKAAICMSLNMYTGIPTDPVSKVSLTRDSRQALHAPPPNYYLCLSLVPMEAHACFILKNGIPGDRDKKQGGKVYG